MLRSASLIALSLAVAAPLSTAAAQYQQQPTAPSQAQTRTSPASAQPAPYGQPAQLQPPPPATAIPAPPRVDSQTAYFAQAQTTQPQGLPTGRSQQPGQTQQSRQANQGYVSGRPQTYAVPAGQSVYQSRAYPAQQTAGAQTQKVRMQQEAPKTYAKGRGRAELRLGWDHVRIESDMEEENENGVLYGISAGYDRDFGNAFVGGFASIDWTSAEFSAEEMTDTSETSLEASIGRDLELGIRAGYWLADGINVYGFAALTNLKREIETSVVTITPADPADTTSVETRSDPVVASVDEFTDGWRIGAGSEVEFPTGIYAKAEYRYSDYGEDNVFDQEIARHQVITGIGLRF